ncbi:MULTISPECIES: glycosyl hydrolase [Arenibacter]|uniref:Alpha-L-rhamnosidase n=1 Tax=Arenibacter algicola TaxID=616991 RepID=A0A221UYS1_9FLAO|nr:MULTISPECIES: glycosyl hydrolase [Arenibacter]ASO06482.1 alpha-L-rhamnosidase [Arenibacter algicola]
MSGLTGVNAQKIIPSDLKKEFSDPPMKSWPKTYWWWINGNIDTVRIKEEIISMKNAGLSGFDIFEIGVPKWAPEGTKVPPGEITFMGDDFLHAVKIALDEAGKLDMEVGLNMASSWNAGGSWITPEYAAKSIYFSKVEFNKKGMKLPFPKLVRTVIKGKIVLEEDQKELDIEKNKQGKPVYFREVAVLALPKGTSSKKDAFENVIDVTEYFDPKTERLNWEAPQGKFEIFRYICSNSGEKLKLPSENSDGLIVDHFDADATAFHFNHIIDRLKTILGDDFSKSSLKSLYLASYEALGTVWTETLPEKFKELNGYGIEKYLPVLFNDEAFAGPSPGNLQRDFQFTLSELMIDNFYRKAKEVANSHGLKINSESGGPGFPLHNVPVEPLKSLGVMDLPRGEFWINHTRFNDDGIDILRVVKEVSSASHIYGNGVVEEEAFTSFQHWQEGPFEMKPMGDRAFCEGMNKVVVHGSTHNSRGSGNPGWVYHAGTHYNDKRVWWPKVKPFNQYLSRISNVMQKTDFTADVLYFYGSAVPNFTGSKNSRFYVGTGFDYEVVNSEILMRTTVEKGQLVLPTGAKFKMLALAPEEEIMPEILDKLKQLAAKGAKIVSEKPKSLIDRSTVSSPNLTTSDIDELWADLTNSPDKAMSIKGKVFSGISSKELLRQMDVSPDFTYDDTGFNILDYIHYSRNGSDYYFVRNTTDQWVSRNCTFRQEGKTPEIWDPLTGNINEVTIFRSNGRGIQLPLTLAPYGSAFVVFSKGGTSSGTYTNISTISQDPPLLNYTENGTMILDQGDFTLEQGDKKTFITNRIKEQPLSGAWELFFPNVQDAPERVVLPALIPWSESEIEGIKYFSGTAKYVKTFTYAINSSTAENQRIFLELGELSNIGEVWLNGQNLGVSWTKPHRFDVTKLIKPGENLLEIEIANTWSNRLKGDAITGKNFTNTNIQSTSINGLNKIKVPWKEVPLMGSGLKGPVKLIFLSTIK